MTVVPSRFFLGGFFFLVNPIGFRLKDAVDKVSTERRASAEYGGVTQLLTDLLASLINFIRRAATLAVGAATLGYSHGRDLGVVRILALWRGRVTAVVVIGRLGRGRGRRSVKAGLLAMVDLHVVLGEDALGAGTLVAAHPPVVVHVLVHGNAVVPLEGEVAVVGRLVPVHGARARDDGL